MQILISVNSCAASLMFLNIRIYMDVSPVSLSDFRHDLWKPYKMIKGVKIVTDLKQLLQYILTLRRTESLGIAQCKVMKNYI